VRAWSSCHDISVLNSEGVLVLSRFPPVKRVAIEEGRAFVVAAQCGGQNQQ